MTDDRAPEGSAPPAPEDPAPTEQTPAPPARVEPVVVPRWIQLVALTLGLLALWALAQAAGVVLLVFLIAAVIALVLNPLVKLFQRWHLPHGLAVVAVYLSFFVVLAAGAGLLANPVADQVQALQRDFPELVSSANRSLVELQAWLNERGIDVKVSEPGQTALQTLQTNVLKGSGDVVSFTQDLLARLIQTGFAVILIMVISIYMLVYAPRIGDLVRSAMPPGDGSPEDDFPLRAQKAVFNYVRGQLLFSLIMGASAGLALWIFGLVGIFPEGQRYALFFGVFFGVMELVPYVGPVLGALPPIIVALFNDPLTALWVVLLFVALQQLEGHVVAPQVFGQALRINPLLVIFALLVGGELYGIVGAFVALPLAAVARETVVYLRRHLVLEPWGTPSAATVAGGANAGARATDRAPPGAPGRHCSECGAPGDPEDAHCRSCGAALRPVEVAG